jgi:hypothetical protein
MPSPVCFKRVVHGSSVLGQFGMNLICLFSLINLVLTKKYFLTSLNLNRKYDVTLNIKKYFN